MATLIIYQEASCWCYSDSVFQEFEIKHRKVICAAGQSGVAVAER